MDIGTLILALLAVALLVVAARRPETVAGPALTAAAADIVKLLPRLVAMLLMAGFVARVLPGEVIGQAIGAESGLVGILVASAVGGFVPGGPIVAFPIVVVLFEAGAGVPQVVAFLTAWSAFALHRVMLYELTLLGWRFSVLRLASSAVLPPLAGLIAAAIMGLDLFG